MIDLNNLKENHQIEAKSAKGGLPSSIWETYSAFANTYGGMIILGVRENRNNGFLPVGLSEFEANNLVKVFWDTIHSNKVSVNLLSDDDIKVQEVNNSFIVVINIPSANKQQRPVFINNNLLNGTFRRNHEGDYRCAIYEIQSMIRDKDTQSNDSYTFEECPIDMIKTESLQKYIIHFKNSRGDSHPFTKADTDTFLYQIGAANYDKNGILHPTKAGLLMFGMEYDITKFFPNYFLDYQDHRNAVGNLRWVQRIVSSSGEWSGNLYDFYFRICNKLQEDIARPFKLEGIFRVDDTNVHKAMREALCNTISNADFNDTSGIVIKQYNDRVVFSNPGTLGLPLEKMLIGGDSQARNKNILKIFSLVNIGERAGSGIPLIFTASEDAGLPIPLITETFNPAQTTLVFYIQDKSKMINIPDEDKILPIKEEILPFGNNNLPIDEKKLPIAIITNSNYNNRVKEKLIFIVNNLYNDFITRSKIKSLLFVSDKTAYNLIINLLDLELIEPVKGQGKGCYRFSKKNY